MLLLPLLLASSCSKGHEQAEQLVWLVEATKDTTLVVVGPPDVTVRGPHSFLPKKGSSTYYAWPADSCGLRSAQACAAAEFFWDGYDLEGGRHPLWAPTCRFGDPPPLWDGFRIAYLTSNDAATQFERMSLAHRRIAVGCSTHEEHINSPPSPGEVVYRETVTQARTKEGLHELAATVEYEGETSRCTSQWSGATVDLRVWRMGLLKALTCAQLSSKSVSAHLPELPESTLYRLELEIGLFEITVPTPHDKIESTEEKYDRLSLYTESLGWWQTSPE